MFFAQMCLRLQFRNVSGCVVGFVCPSRQVQDVSCVCMCVLKQKGEPMVLVLSIFLGCYEASLCPPRVQSRTRVPVHIHVFARKV